MAVARSRRWPAVLGCLVVFCTACDGASFPMGTNLASLRDWTTVNPFVDAFKCSRPWISGSAAAWQDGRPLALDEHGWVRSLQPGQIARTLMFWDRPNTYPAGRYIVEYDGRGTLAYGGSGRKVGGQAGRDKVEVDPARGGLALFITATDPADYLRDIRVVIPGAGAEPLFHPLFLDSLKGYRALRFMNWSEQLLTTGDQRLAWQPKQWADRPRVEDARYSIKGAPVEIMVALANRLGVDPWFTMPWTVDDDYLRQFAELVKKLLDPKLTVYLEYSNEVWNGGYPQALDAQRKGVAAKLGDNPFHSQMRWYGVRTREVAAIWEQVFPPDRLVRVLASQAANPWVSEQALGVGDTARHVDALAIAPYFGGRLGRPQDLARVQRLSLDELMAELANVSLPEAITSMTQQAAVAKKYGKLMVAYEGGQHLVGVGPAMDDAAINKLFDAANRDPRMGQLYDRYFAGWRDAGGQLFMNFIHCDGYSKYGRFGVMEYLSQPPEQSPKLMSVRRWMEQAG